MPVIVTSSDAIEYLEMALKVEGWSDPTTSASFQIISVVKSLQSSIDSMTTSDNGLVDQLRDMSTNWYFCAMDDKKVLAAAAAEIERLRAENTQLRIERDSYLHSFEVAIGMADDSEDDSEGDPIALSCAENPKTPQKEIK
jgi:hypothetical protein